MGNKVRVYSGADLRRVLLNAGFPAGATWITSQAYVVPTAASIARVGRQLGKTLGQFAVRPEPEKFDCFAYSILGVGFALLSHGKFYEGEHAVGAGLVIGAEPTGIHVCLFALTPPSEVGGDPGVGFFEPQERLKRCDDLSPVYFSLC